MGVLPPPPPPPRSTSAPEPLVRGGRLYIDDVRDTPVGFTHRAYNYAEAIALLSDESIEWEFVSFDHDLAPDHYDAEAAKVSTAKNGHDIAKWVEEQAMLAGVEGAEGSGSRELRKPFGWRVHSLNPEGSHRIIMALKSADRFWREAGHEPPGPTDGPRWFQKT